VAPSGVQMRTLISRDFC